MRNNLKIVQELEERPRGQLLRCKLPIPREVFSKMLEDPNVQAWALAMPKAERAKAIQDGINRGLVEVQNL